MRLIKFGKAGWILILMITMAFGCRLMDRKPQAAPVRITVTVQERGASPIQIEQALCNPIEAQIRQLDGVSQVSSESKLGEAKLVIDFDVRIHPDSARRQVQQVMQRLATTELPADVKFTIQ